MPLTHPAADIWVPAASLVAVTAHAGGSPSSTVLTNVIFTDGSVRGLADSFSPQVLEALVTMAGGEEVGPVGE